MKYLRLLSLLITACLLSACHFHLRGKMPISPQMKKTYLQISSMYTPFSQAIQKSLKAAGIDLVSSPQQANIILTISNPSKPQNLSTVGASQEVRQYNLTYSFDYSLQTNKGKPIYGPITVTSTRQLIVQPNQILSNDNKTQQLYVDMRQDAVIDLVYQLSAVDTRKAIAAAFKTEPKAAPKATPKLKHKPTHEAKA